MPSHSGISGFQWSEAQRGWTSHVVATRNDLAVHVPREGTPNPNRPKIAEPSRAAGLSTLVIGRSFENPVDKKTTRFKEGSGLLLSRTTVIADGDHWLGVQDVTHFGIMMSWHQDYHQNSTRAFHVSISSKMRSCCSKRNSIATFLFPCTSVPSHK